MKSPEERYVKNIDTAKAPPLEVGDQEKNAEQAVMNFFESIPGMEMRFATSEEDSGKSQIVKDKAIDMVGYMGGKPAIGLQITTATDSVVRHRKTADLLDRPFIRLPEMNSSDTAIPRSLVFIDAAEVSAFLHDRDLGKHPKLIKQIIESNLSSLKLDLMKTQNPKEQELIQKLVSFFEESRLAFERKADTTIH
jgi:hypothetical protein